MEEKMIELLLGKKADLSNIDKKVLKQKIRHLLKVLKVAQDK